MDTSYISNSAIFISTAAARSALGGLVFSALAGALLFSTQSAVAVPSFARQTGIPCEACHTVFPVLTGLRTANIRELIWSRVDLDRAHA